MTFWEVVLAVIVARFLVFVCGWMLALIFGFLGALSIEKEAVRRKGQ